MGRTRILLYQISRVMAILLLLSGSLQNGKWVLAIVALVFGILWLIGSKCIKKNLSFVFLTGYTLIAVGSLLIDASPMLMVAGITLALFGWQFDGGLPVADHSTESDGFQRNHLFWSGIASSIGLALGFVCLWLNFSLPFIAVFFIVLFVFVCMFLLVSFFTKTGAE